MFEPAEASIKEAQSLLNDPAGISYTTEKLMPLLVKAYRELQQKLQKAGQPVAKEVSEEITVDAGVTSMEEEEILPEDLLYPISVAERVGTVFIPMTERMWEPEVPQSTRLIYWTWRDEDIKFLGSTNDVVIKIRYMKGLPNLDDTTSIVRVSNATTFLASRTAAIAALVIGENETRAAALNNDAIEAWDDLKTTSVKSRQSMPVRRRVNRYRR